MYNILSFCFVPVLKNTFFYTNLKRQFSWAFLDIEILVSSYLLSGLENLSLCSSWLWESLVLFGYLWVSWPLSFIPVNIFLNLFFDIVTMTCYRESNLPLCNSSCLKFFKKNQHIFFVYFISLQTVHKSGNILNMLKKSDLKQY